MDESLEEHSCDQLAREIKLVVISCNAFVQERVEWVEVVAEDFNDARVVRRHRKLETLILGLLLLAVQHVHKLDELFTVDHLACIKRQKTKHLMMLTNDELTSVIVIDCTVLVIYD